MSSMRIAGAAWLVFSVVGFVSAGVIFKSGEEIDATASLEGGLVYVTLANGMMQAYDSGDVDLEASGLVPVVSGKSSFNQKPTIATLGGQRLEDRPPAKSGTLIRITDADVIHIVPGESLTNAGDASLEPKLIVSGVRKQRSGNLFKISGLISNAGEGIVDSIIVRASAIDHEGQGCGQRSAEVPGQLEPGQNVRFTIELGVNNEVKDLRVEAHGKEKRLSGENS